MQKRFEDAWQRGERPEPDDYLSQARTPEERQALLLELALDHLDFRLEAGEVARVEEYLTRYPELAGQPHAVLVLIQVERDQRQRRELGLNLEEYWRRFPAFQHLLREGNEERQALHVAEGRTVSAKLNLLLGIPALQKQLH